MKIKITSTNSPDLQKTLEDFCSLVNLAILRGRRSKSEHDQYSITDEKIDFFPPVNDYKGFWESRTDTQIEIMLHGRYQRNQEILNAAAELATVIWAGDVWKDKIEIIEK